MQIDPQVGYVTTAWWLEYATAAKLFNYPDRTGQAGALLRPEVASRYSVSRDGRTWTFVLRRGFRFSDGSPVTARSFKYAIDRAANHDLASPAAAFITDPNGTEIVGARDVNADRTRHVRGVRARGYRLTIRLTRPSWALPTILAMPFFQATSTTLPLEREVLTGYPSAGPYAFTKHVSDGTTRCGATGTTAAHGHIISPASMSSGTFRATPSGLNCRHTTRGGRRSRTPRFRALSRSTASTKRASGSSRRTASATSS